MQDEAKVVIDGDRIIFGRIAPSVDPENPCDPAYDGAGRMYSFCRKHSNYVELQADTADEAREELKRISPDHVVLSYYEHGNCVWFPEGTGSAGTDCRFDGVRLAGYWEPSKSILDDIAGLERMESDSLTPDDRARSRREHLVGYAVVACELYTDWCNGEVFDIQVEAYNLRKNGDQVYDKPADYRYDETVFEESDYQVIGMAEVNRLLEKYMENARKK